MKLKELIAEGKWASDFQKYRQLGQNPLKLASHVAKRAVGATVGDTGSGGTVGKSSLGDTTEIKGIIDRVLAGQTLDSQHLQALKVFRRKL